MNILGSFIVLALGLCLSGCALFGGAHYDYSHTSSDGGSCTMKVDSGRTFEKGISAEIDKDCKVKVKASSVEEGQNSLEAVTALIKAAKEPATVAEPAKK